MSRWDAPQIAFEKSVMSRLVPLSLDQRNEMQLLINQGIDPLEARALVVGYVAKSGNFEEAKHPRDHGKFSESSGGAAEPKGAMQSKPFREAKRQERNAQDALGRAKSARANGDNARAAQHDAEFKQHMEASHAAMQEHRATQATAPKAEAQKPAAITVDPSRPSHLSQAHFDNAERSLARSASHQQKAKDAKEAGDDALATTHLQLAAQANANARGELTKEHNDHARLNQSREAEGKEGYFHDDARHAKLSEQHENNRAAIAAAKPQAAKDKSQAAAGHAERAEHALGASRAAAQSGDKDVANQKLSEARRETTQAQNKMPRGNDGTSAEQNAQLGMKTRIARSRSETKEGVDKKPLERAERQGARAVAHDKASEKYAKEGHTERASHHAREAASARHEAHASLGGFVESLNQAANYSLKKSIDARADAYLSAFAAPVSKADANELAYMQQALSLQSPAVASTPDDVGITPAGRSALNGHRLVQGMDMNMLTDGMTPDIARARASRTLLERPGHFDAVGATPDVLPQSGIMLDLGSGQSRALGHLGIDLHPYDYGTVLWDLDLGIPFPDGCARAVRMTHSLHPMLDAYGEARSPVPILLEIQRVLQVGGYFYYEGPEPLFEEGDMWPLPGLALMANDRGVGEGAPCRQSFVRTPLRVPDFPGADARYQAAPEMPVDAAMAMLALNASPAQVAMANLVQKAESFVPIVKADSAKQICYGEVLNPLTVDAQNDWLTAEDIENAAHDYMMKSRVIHSEHGDPIGASVVESFIAPQDLSFDGPTGPVNVPKGSWLVGVKVTDPKEWEALKSGDYSGFSIGGYGMREEAMPGAA